jgi:hypothetical protein
MAMNFTVLFMAWFVLPSCECQLKELFGDSEEVSEIVDSSFITLADSDEGNSSHCHCDDDSDKTFVIHSADIVIPECVSTTINYYDIENQIAQHSFEAIPTNRGPPADVLCHKLYSLSQYIVHCTYLI